MKIITGHTGENHVTSYDDRALHAGIFGSGSYVLDTGTRLEASVITANTIRISEGDIMHQGTHARIPYGEYKDVTIDNGTTGYKRKDLIMAYYLRLGDIETMTIEVRKGIPDAADPLEPACLGGNILEGDRQSEMPLYLVELDGVNVVSVTPKFKVLHTADNVYPKSKTYTKEETYNKGETYNKDETEHLISIAERDINARFTAVNLNLTDAEKKIDGFSKRFDAIEQRLMTLEQKISVLEN